MATRSQTIVTRRPSLWPIVFALGLLVTAAFIGLPSLAPPLAPEPAPLRTIPHTDLNPYGANFFLHREVETWKIEKTLALAREAGIGWGKQHFPWETVEPRKGVFLNESLSRPAWEKLDEIVAVANKHGIRLIVRLDRPPAWARSERPNPPEGQHPPTSVREYGDFVYAVVSRYRGSVQHYQIWNEPNLAREWGGRPPSADEYVELLKEAYRRAKEADPNVVVLSAPLAQTVEVSARATTEMAFLEGMYRAGARSYFDVLFANGYGFDRPPEEAPRADELNFQRVVLLRNVMERNGDAGKAIWFNEFGWNASPADLPADRLIWRRVTEAQQADYTARAVQYARANWPWVGVFNLWYFRQPGFLAPTDSEYYFRMVDVGFTERLVYRRLKEATRDLRIATAGAYQESNPALQTVRGWSTIRDSAASAGERLASWTVGDSASIRFNGSGLDLVVVKGPRAGMVQVTVDGRDAELLRRPGRPGAVLDLYSPNWELATLPVASGLAAREHETVLIVAGERNAASSGNEVVLDGFVVRPPNTVGWDKLGLAAGLSLAAGAILFWSRWQVRSG